MEAVSRAVRVLENLRIEQRDLLRDVEEDVLRLMAQLQLMQSVLVGVTKQTRGARTHELLGEIRKLSLDAEDALLIFVVNAHNATGMRSERVRRCIALPNHIKRLREEIESIQRGFDAIRSRFQECGIHVDDDERRRHLRRFEGWINDVRVVGLEEDANVLLKIIAKQSDQSLCVAIVGMGGIGKTTLAWKIYQHADIVHRFECRAWVVVSPEFAPENVIKEIMSQLRISMPAERNSLQALQETLCKHLLNKKYFVVLDDVWEPTHWEFLKAAFPPGRLLITSRNKGVLGNAHDFVHVHEMKLLEPKQSWQLFLRNAFASGVHCPEELEETGKRIVEMCYGLPSAIIVAGGVLSLQNKSERVWQSFLEEIHSHLGNFLGEIFEVSYQNLAPHLKSCFLSLAFFREDAVLAKKLIQVWIAHGLVEAGEGATTEDIARGYLDELINRYMVQLKDVTKDGRVKTCQTHDLFRRVLMEKAKEEMYFEEGSSHSSDRPRHRAVYCSEGRFLDSIDSRNKRIHSLFVRKEGEKDAFNPPSSYWKSFELLKVVDMEGCGVRKLPDAIGKLFWLRYLGLQDNNIDELPESMSKLENLQVIDSRGGYLKLPAFVWTMRSLRRLNSSEIWLAGSQTVENFTLETLGDLVLEDAQMIEQLKKMVGLKKLGIILWNISVSDVRNLFASLYTLQNLSSLSLKSYFTLTLGGLGTLHRITKLKLEGHIDKLPSARDFPLNLSYLTLNRTALRVDPLPVLGELPVLLYLKLDYEAYRGERMEILHGGFARLRSISVRSLGNLEKINVGEGAMPELQRWEIKECPNLDIENIPRSAVRC